MTGLMHRRLRRAALPLIPIFLALPLAAQESESWELGGHQVTLSETENFTHTITADGEVLLEDELVFIDAPLEVAGQSVLTGSAGAGGNACDGTPFVLSLKEGKVRIDGPIDACASFETQVQPEALIFHTAAIPGTPAEIWVWNPTSGLTEASPEPFTPKEGQDWDDFASLSDQHPIDALGFAPVYSQVLEGMSPEDWSAYTTILSQLGSGGTQPEGYFGNACTKLVCEEEWAALWIDPVSRKAFALWKNEADDFPKSFPEDTSDWPDWVIGSMVELTGAAN